VEVIAKILQTRRPNRLQLKPAAEVVLDATLCNFGEAKRDHIHCIGNGLRMVEKNGKGLIGRQFGSASKTAILPVKAVLEVFLKFVLEITF
jgi:hypothetical protein